MFTDTEGRGGTGDSVVKPTLTNKNLSEDETVSSAEKKAASVQEEQSGKLALAVISQVSQL